VNFRSGFTLRAATCALTDWQVSSHVETIRFEEIEPRPELPFALRDATAKRLRSYAVVSYGTDDNAQNCRIKWITTLLFVSDTERKKQRCFHSHNKCQLRFFILT